MIEADAPIRPFYDGWQNINARLIDAIRALSDEDLELRAAPDQWPIWAMAAHMALARVYWLCGIFQEPGAEATPFPDFKAGLIMRLITHDAYHCGEISQVLGRNGLPQLDLWSRPD